MTVDTSREAVEDLIAEARDYARDDRYADAELLRETAQTLAALLDERDVAIKNRQYETEQKVKLAKRIRDLEAAMDGLRMMNTALAEQRDASRKLHALALDRAERAEAKLNAVKGLASHVADSEPEGYVYAMDDVLAILADTDEGSSDE